MNEVTMTSDQARINWRDAVDTAFEGSAVIIERYGKPVVTVLNYNQWQRMSKQMVQQADELARLRRIVKSDSILARMRAGDYVDLDNLDKELAALDASTPKP
jgi:hypothetical protein